MCKTILISVALLRGEKLFFHCLANIFKYILLEFELKFIDENLYKYLQGKLNKDIYPEK